MSTSENRDRGQEANDHSNRGYSTRDNGRSGAVPVEPTSSLREEVAEREQQRFGGVKIGSAFFGWLAAMGMAVLLTALAAAAGTAIGLGLTGDVEDATGAAAENAETVGWIGAISLVVIMLIAYYSGGYVAGRMARFSGAVQGVAVWIWAVVIAIVVAIVVAVGGTEFNILADVNGFPRIPINEGDLTTMSVVTLVLVAVASLVGAILGGMAGMRFHRRVDRVGLGR
ncbi:MAG TPA: hypothetical protein VFT01_06025 [Homoserinimonas sp.]|nr:hypothetical protein [Homoserinimonas sp.]